MTQQEIYPRLAKIMRDVFDDDNLVVTVQGFDIEGNDADIDAAIDLSIQSAVRFVAGMVVPIPAPTFGGVTSVTKVVHVPPKKPPPVCARMLARQSAGLPGANQPRNEQLPPPCDVHSVETD